ISCVDNHLYYNLEHYYAAIRALPGGEKNIDNWHKMIGGKITGADIPYHSTELTKFETLTTILSLIRIAWKKNNIFSSFLNQLERLRITLESELSQCSTPREITLYLDNLVKRPLGFGLTVVNDVFIMMGLGYLSKRLVKRG